MRAVAAMALISIVLSALTGCARLDVSSFPSPDGRLVAKLFEYHEAPMASNDEKVEICPRIALPFQCETVFEGEDMDGKASTAGLFGPMNVSWRSGHLLIISYCDGDVGNADPLKMYKNIGVTVILVKENHEDWPPTVPIDRRIGTAPCS